MTLREAKDAAGRAYIEELLARHLGNVTTAAAEAGVFRTNFYRVCRRHGVPAPRAHRGTWYDEPRAASS